MACSGPHSSTIIVSNPKGLVTELTPSHNVAPGKYVSWSRDEGTTTGVCTYSRHAAAVRQMLSSSVAQAFALAKCQPVFYVRVKALGACARSVVSESRRNAGLLRWQLGREGFRVGPCSFTRTAHTPRCSNCMVPAVAESGLRLSYAERKLGELQ